MIRDLKFVTNNFACISSFIRTVETDTIPTEQFFNLLDGVENALKDNPNVPNAVVNHFEKVFKRNEGFQCIKKFFESKLNAKSSNSTAFIVLE